METSVMGGLRAPKMGRIRDKNTGVCDANGQIRDKNTGACDVNNGAFIWKGLCGEEGGGRAVLEFTEQEWTKTARVVMVEEHSHQLHR